MKFDFDSIDKPIYMQIVEQIEDGILEWIYPEETQIPSSTEIAVTYRINPATINKGVNILVEKGIIYKKRGIGMFVSLNARKTILKDRKSGFSENFIKPLLIEAKRLGLKREDVVDLLNSEEKDDWSKKSNKSI